MQSSLVGLMIWLHGPRESYTGLALGARKLTTSLSKDRTCLTENSPGCCPDLKVPNRP